MARFPTRTLVLMGLALLSFGWMWWQTHRPPPPARPEAGPTVTIKQLSGVGAIGPAGPADAGAP